MNEAGSLIDAKGCVAVLGAQGITALVPLTSVPGWPQPISELNGQPLWREEDVQAWIVQQKARSRSRAESIRAAIEQGPAQPSAGVDATCLFCGQMNRPGQELVRGPSQSICPGCVARVQAALQEHSTAATSDPEAPSPQGECSFCSRPNESQRTLIGISGQGYICRECLRLCDEVVRERMLTGA